jgi:D-alanine transaminase
MPAKPATLCYFDGRFLPLCDVAVSPFDRGYNFGDGVYEMLRVYNGVPFALDEHVERLFRSAAGIDIRPRLSPRDYRDLIVALVERAGWADAAVYGQLTRGDAPRDHVWDENIAPIDFWTVKPLVSPKFGRTMISVPDERWSRCEIKAISLLPNVLAKQRARRVGADEALFVMPNGIATEGGACNLFAVKDGVLYTHPIGGKVLPGVTRAITLKICKKMGVPVVEEGRSLDFHRDADEVFVCSTTMEIQPLLQLDWRPIADARPGPMTMRLRQAFLDYVRQACGDAPPLAGEVDGADVGVETMARVG